MSSAFERLQKLAQQKKDQEKPKLEIVGKDTQPTQPIQDNQPKVHKERNQDNQPNPPKTVKPVSPEKDFTKVPNSVTRNAVPERLFKGMSKNTYDALYLKTRGAISPVRKIRATKSDLIRWTGVSDVTLDKHLKHLKSVGLVTWEFIIGSHEGNWYEVFIPEEIDLSNLTYLTNPTEDNQPKKVGGEIPNLVGGVGGVYLLENKEDTATPKTLYKTNIIDDDSVRINDGFFLMNKKLSDAVEKITGKKVSKQDAKSWSDLADLLVLELETAAAQTGNVSSVPAFLTEVLRRQFLNLKPQQGSNRKKLTPNTVGKSDDSEFEIKALDQDERQKTLSVLKDLPNKEDIADFEKYYLPEDWKWLTEQLNKN